MSDVTTLLRDGLCALGIPFDNTSEQRLLAYVALLQRWNQTHNLTAITDAPAMITHHILDSLTLWPYLPKGRLLDVGSGAGLPGLVLALVDASREIVVLDSQLKKTVFLQHVVTQFGLSQVTVVHSRVEDYTSPLCFPCIVSRAVGRTDVLVRITQHLACKEGQIIMMKGHYPDAELALIAQSYEVVSVTVPGLVAKRHLVMVKV